MNTLPNYIYIYIYVIIASVPSANPAAGPGTYVLSALETTPLSQTDLPRRVICMLENVQSVGTAAEQGYIDLYEPTQGLY